MGKQVACELDYKGRPMLVRTRWRNEKGRHFDSIQQYRLLCTRNWMGNDKRTGYAFTMIPEDNTPESLKSTAEEDDYGLASPLDTWGPKRVRLKQ